MFQCNFILTEQKNTRTEASCNTLRALLVFLFATKIKD